MSKRPKIRVAKFGDIPAIVDLTVTILSVSRYAKFCKADPKRIRSVAMQAIQRHGGSTEGSSFVAVADNGSKIEGLIIGVLQPLYLVFDVLEATDICWITRKGAHASTAGRLLKAMHKWAPPGSVIRQGNTDIISDIELSGRLFERHGMKLCGHIYEKTKE